MKSPEPPAGLSEAAAAEWKRLARRLTRNGKLTPETIGIFAAYCQSLATWQESQKHPATQTAVSKTGHEWSAPSAWFVVGQRSYAAMASAARLLGLSQAGMRRRKKKPEDKFAQILRPRIAE